MLRAVLGQILQQMKQAGEKCLGEMQKVVAGVIENLSDGLKFPGIIA